MDATRPRFRNAGLALAAVIGLLAAACAGAPAGRPGAVDPVAGPSVTVPTRPDPATSPAPEPTSTHHTNRPPPAPQSTLPPDPGLPASLLGAQWYALPTTKRVVALTFDAGANADAVPSILRTLADKGVPGTFFLTGNWVEVYPSFAAQIGATYPVGDHTYSHPDLTGLGDDAVRQEITTAAAAIQGATGRDPRPMFRFPFGASDPRTLELVNELGYGAINWTVDTRGWQGTSGGQSAELVVDRVLEALRPGAIVIMHVGSNPDDHSTLDADALPRVIEEILARGYTFVTVDEYL